MKIKLHGVEAFWKKMALDKFAKPEPSRIVDQVRGEMRGIKVVPRPVAEICFEG